MMQRTDCTRSAEPVPVQCSVVAQCVDAVAWLYLPPAATPVATHLVTPLSLSIAHSPVLYRATCVCSLSLRSPYVFQRCVCVCASLRYSTRSGGISSPAAPGAGCRRRRFGWSVLPAAPCTAGRRARLLCIMCNAKALHHQRTQPGRPECCLHLWHSYGSELRSG